MYYEIENDPRTPAPVYDGLGLPACKARARRLSTKGDRLVYILVTRRGEDKPCGQIVFADGRQQYVEGDVA